MCTVTPRSLSDEAQSLCPQLFLLLTLMLVMQAFWQDYQPYGLWKPKVVFTIHNLNYGQKKIAEAALFSQRFTTVSPTYAYETGMSQV